MIDTVPEELWAEVHDILQGGSDQDHPQEKEMQKAKRLSEEGFLLSSCYSLELCIQVGISFLFTFASLFSSFHSYL